jgi:hypothetical protein
MGTNALIAISYSIPKDIKKYTGIYQTWLEIPQRKLSSQKAYKECDVSSF